MLEVKNFSIYKVDSDTAVDLDPALDSNPLVDSDPSVDWDQWQVELELELKNVSQTP